MNKTRRDLLFGAAAVAGTFGLVAQPAQAASAQQIDRDARQALQALYASQPKAHGLASKAKAILIFPRIIKAGLLIGGQTGDGVLMAGNKPQGYYNITAASFGLQAGAQRFSFALFFMNDEALQYLRQSEGWAIGSGPSVVVVDQGAAKSLTSTTLAQDVYAIPFGQHGLMAGVGLEGSKITQITPDK